MGPSVSILDQCMAMARTWLSAPWFGPPVEVWVGSIGFLIGAVEIVARYKGDPMRALRSLPAVLYIAVNVLACLIMLACLRLIQPDWLFSDLKDQPGRQWLYLILAAGFGAMALFRTSLFKIKTGDGDLGVGPSFLLDTLLFASDRAIDRRVASPRSDAVTGIMKEVSFERAKIALPVYCFAMMQNVPSQEQKDVGTQIKELAVAGLPPEVMAGNLGLLLMNVVGTDVLRQAVRDLAPYIGYDPLTDDRRISAIAELMNGFEIRQAQQVAEACFSLGRPASADTLEETRLRIAQLDQEDIEPRLKALILGRWLVDLVGHSTVALVVGRPKEPPTPDGGDGPKTGQDPEAGPRRDPAA